LFQCSRAASRILNPILSGPFQSNMMPWILRNMSLPSTSFLLTIRLFFFLARLLCPFPTLSADIRDPKLSMKLFSFFWIGQALIHAVASFLPPLMQRWGGSEACHLHSSFWVCLWWLGAPPICPNFFAPFIRPAPDSSDVTVSGVVAARYLLVFLSVEQCSVGESPFSFL